MLLRELLQLIEQNDGELSLVELGQRLGADPSAVAGMLETLRQKHRIREVGAGCGPDGGPTFCEDCSLRRNCRRSAARVRRFQIVN